LRESDPADQARFERLVLPNIDAAFNLAYWLLGSREDAEDVAQEGLLRAYRYFRGFHGGDPRAWLLRIVRNTCYSWLEKNRTVEANVPFDEEFHRQTSVTPEGLAITGNDRDVSNGPSRPCRLVFAKCSSSENSKVVPARRSPLSRRCLSAR
jgi:RNA polymerase sigma factor (sigma-70 family)